MKSVYILFRAYSLIVVSMFAILVVVMITNLNPKATDSAVKEINAPGDIVAHIVWPNGDIDVDLWLSGPGEPAPVGYSNKGGILWNLLRDDLGTLPDATPVNYEDAFTRGIVPGEYIINVQCYRCDKAIFPMTVDVAVSKRARVGMQALNNFVITRVILKQDGQEKTAVRFVVDQNGEVDRESINNVYAKLRGDVVPSALTEIPDQYNNGGM